MQNFVLSNIISFGDITELLNNSDVKLNKEKLSIQNVVKFSISLSTVIKKKLEDSLSIDLSNVSTIPMRWIKGDTLPHVDKGETEFNTTYLIYLTDSSGSLIVDGINYPILAGDAHIFSEGLEHSTIDCGNDERLMIGPMSESGFAVGGGISYYPNQTSAQDKTGSIGGTGNYTIIPIDGISSWRILSNSTSSEIGTSPNGGPYNVGDELIPGPQYYLYPFNSPVSNTCFPANTPINTDQGIIPIEKINLLNTIRNKKIIAITQTVTTDKYLICFEKDSISNNIPCEKTIISKNHLVFNRGNMIKAKDFIGKYKNIYKINYKNEILYNVLLEDYDKMIVNNLICETLHHDNSIAKLYCLLPNYNLEQQSQFIKEYNNIVTKLHN
jgi:hypothetical protein